MDLPRPLEVQSFLQSTRVIFAAIQGRYALFRFDTLDSMPLNTAKIGDFSGGINQRDPSVEIETNESAFMQECEVLHSGKALATRRGIKEFTATTLPTVPGGNILDTNIITSIQTYRATTGTPDKIVMGNKAGGIYTLDPNSAAGTVTVALATSGANAEYMFVQAQDVALTEYVWCMAPGLTPKKMLISTGVVSNWAGAPPVGSMCRIWKNMMIVSGVAGFPARLYYSKIADPETFTTPGGFIDIKSTDDEEDAITAICPMGENLLVFKESSVWLVFDPITFDNRRIGNVGCLDRLAVDIYLDRAFWVSRQGIYSTDGDTIKCESELWPSFWYSNNPAGSYPGLTITYRTTMRLTVSFDGLLFAYNRRAWGGFLWVSDLKLLREDKLHPWFQFTNAFSDVAAMVKTLNTGHNPANNPRMNLVGINYATGATVQRSIDYLVDNQVGDLINGVTTAVNGSYHTPWLKLQGTENIERVRRVNVLCSSLSGVGDLRTVFYRNWDENTVFLDVSHGATIGLTEMVRIRPEVRARAMKIKFTLKAQVQINEIEIKYRGGKEH